MSFLNAEEPSACDLVTDFGIQHPLAPLARHGAGDNLKKMLRDCVSRAISRSICFVFEGTVVTGPNDTGA